MKDFLDLQRQACKTLPHIGVAGRQPNSNPCRKWDHGSVSSPRRIRNRASTSTSPSTRTRRPFAPQSRSAHSPIRYPFQAAPERSSPAQIQGVRQAAPRDTPCATKTKVDWKHRADVPSPRPAVGPTELSSTMRTFASSDHRRRRPVSTISQTTDGASVSKAIHADSQLHPPNSARRPTPDEYLQS